MEKKVKAFLEEKHFSLQDKRIGIGVSGGPDSLALLHYLKSVQKRESFYLVAIHVDHMFRGEESYQEAKFVAAYCKEENIPFEMTRINVPQYMEATGKNGQVAARDCRYQFFAEVMKKQQLTHLALGHHGDDQIETILMRLTRGSTGSGRAGIPFLRSFYEFEIFRPFLCLNREEIEQYCKLHDLHPRRDPSNEKDVYSRNRFRKYVVPFLKKENPQVHVHFLRYSEELSEDERFLETLAIAKMRKVIREKNDKQIIIDIDSFLAMPIPLQRRGIQLILNYLYQGNPSSISAIHIDQVCLLVKGSHPSGSLDFPNGLKVIRSYRQCYFQYDQQKQTSYRFEMHEPGDVILPDGSKISFQYFEGVAKREEHTLFLAEELVSFPFVIRTRKTGDRMSLKGMKGSKKVKDIFIDQKIPLQDRESWPILTDKADQLLWIPGLKKSRFAADLHDKRKKYILVIYNKAIDLPGGK
ncbi:tRNA lysidine(34) synthetase TilS [Bacillaceae bacterium Marseille-Q3522]|nr:tRNA lysidine(34) synthetase TilS [Bacillaceae bacterium Marseille-Q3522]